MGKWLYKLDNGNGSVPVPPGSAGLVLTVSKYLTDSRGFISLLNRFHGFSFFYLINAYFFFPIGFGVFSSTHFRGFMYRTGSRFFFLTFLVI